jgi:dihydroorotate dehydrogenase electron transfer subunit
MSLTMPQSQRNTIFLEQARILEHQSHQGDQYILRIEAPKCAEHARPGSFAHLQCSPERPLRRPLSIMRTSASEGWVDFLYKAVGEGTKLLAERKTGETISVLGPIGKNFEFHHDRPRPLLIGGGVGIPPMVFCADHLTQDEHWKPLVIMGSEVPFPFRTRPSQIIVPGMPEPVIAAMPLLEDWGVPSRLTSLQGYPGCHEGYVTDLARLWLDSLSNEQRAEVEIMSCGPHPMLEAVARLAEEYDLPCQVSLEEFMACAVGGCAGCVVEVATEKGPAMKRVCVDGPVFDSRSVF